ncbi:NAD(P)H-hydrate dehydratase [Qipengyuania gaetbuli]|uniref:NAD(P)H-hydrate dehydratase n=1 Tax=Qipengyuania gaetbuli TaxID=266952 RepID=UPI001CFEFF92|nr:NAD(P)H-hydrate dehydratase [Qipengyuania gaetbuli]
MTDPVLTVEQMRAAERAAMDAGTSEWELMLRAGEGAAHYVHRVAAGRNVCVLCGPGNNGGDGYVIAESLRRRRYAVSVIAPLEPGTETARKARSEFRGEVASDGSPEGAVIVDCLFGYGLARTVEGKFAKLLEAFASSDCYKIAIDVPSTVESDTGKALGPLPDYDLTLALGAWKQAHFLMPAMAAMGCKRLVSLDLPDAGRVARLSAHPRLSAPPKDSHKYRRGLVAVVAGDMPGAPLLSCEAAMRAGAGYVKLMSDLSHPDAPAELVIEQGGLLDNLSDERISSVLVGPGLGRSEEARGRLCAALESGRPCVVDADALHLLDHDVIEGVGTARIVVTPHEGELAALCKSFDVEADSKLDRARKLHDVTGMTVLAKGPDTICVGEGGTVFFDAGPSWLSVAGSGDVLAGVIAARLAGQGEPVRACEEAVWLHHEAARLSGAAFTAGELAGSVNRALEYFL